MKELIIAVPSKGRLEEKASALFRDAGLALIRPMRGYEGRIKGLDKTRVLYLSAGEIATRLLAGDVHLGITGEDLLREKSADMESSVSLLHPLGFGKASVVIGIPDEWADITTMDDLAEMAVDFRKKHNRPIRIATKYRRLTGDFLSNHGVYDAVTEYSDGATEGAPASGAAEAIVDITSTGETLKANGLRILKDGLLLESEANLVASLGAAWEEIPLLQAKALLTQLEARLRAPRYYKMQLIVYGTAG
ncbi:MAG: ATP phosphoribosyltransferase, partial [Alphaproteobacteria bacterium]|nr:ATP phosphoribosyltransferase [Alphaproteobacteria bacterium]